MTEGVYVSGNRNRMRLAFAHIPGDDWSAGTYYLKNLFVALRSLSVENHPVIILLTKQNNISETYDEFFPLVDEVLQQPVIERKTFFVELKINLRKKIGLVKQKENPISAFLKKNNVDIFFALGPPPDNFFLPFLSWIPDFQHCRYPEFFSEQEIKRRDTSFESSARRATQIILSSNCALNDFKKFAPWAIEKARVLSFVAQIPENIYQNNSKLVCDKYNIPERFILLPNQFWKHKNHKIVIQALQIASEKEPALTIVCTGNTNEYRDLVYFSNLLCSISRSGLRERMIILGLVPRNDLFSLMRHSVAVLQPSLFEGWNTAVEEVKSLGKKIIVSDIPVHREQDAAAAIYFDPTDPQSLAKCLLDVFSNGSPGPDAELEKMAKKLLLVRTEEYGNRFLKISHGAIKEWRGLC